MALNELIPFYDKGDKITGRASSPVTGKRCVKITGNRSAVGAGLISTPDGGNYPIAHADAGGKIFGVAGFDGATDDEVPVFRAPKVVPITAGASISAMQEVMVGSSGKVIPLDDTDAVAASLATGLVASNNAITWTANDEGADGNAITVTLVDPGGTTASLSVDVDGNDIIVSLARAASALSSTAAQVIAAILEHDTASQLVTGTNTSTSNGTGIVAAVAKTNLAGGSDAGLGHPVGLALANASLNEDAEISLYQS